MHDLVNAINSYVWSPVLIYLCLGAGLFYSVMTRFVQVRMFKEMWVLLFSGTKTDKGISSFQALSVSLSGRVGTGNISGVAAAIGFGGPGAIFWMWVVAFLGAATAYIESTLAQIYKEEDNGQYRGGPAYYFEKVLGQKWYGILFAIAMIISTGLCLPMVQSNSIGNAISNAFGSGSVVETAVGSFEFTKILCGTLILIALGFIIFGGVKRIAAFAQIVVPFMALAYIIVACVIVALNITELPGIIGQIVGDAFTPMAGFGAAIGWGVKRGVYSNEAGQGTGPHHAAAAEVDHPAQQGIVQAFSVYVDTLFVCSATAFMILITGAYNVHGNGDAFLIQNLAATIDANSPAFTQYAVETTLPGVGGIFIAIALLFFAFTTILAYYYIAETNVAYINRFVHIPVLSLFMKLGLMAVVFYGTINTASLAWGIGDLGLGMTVWLNVVGILIIFFISKPAIIALKDYEQQRKDGVSAYAFNPEKLGIKNADFWEMRLNGTANASSGTNTDSGENPKTV
ncbi:alanine/glycine:cation symporter family protein [Sessilibacter corallicola]|uniref:Alanine/glycine:cation symporter family protein n=1 Tax=Sessilibacter corallicola TaxID=2904075 RepID=A0ABQ0AB63_9GAMM